MGNTIQSTPDPRPQTPELLALALDFHNRDSFEHAKSLYQQILLREPSNIIALINLSLLTDNKESIILLRKALRVDRTNEIAKKYLMIKLRDEKNEKFDQKNNFISGYPWITSNGDSATEEIIDLVTTLPFNGIFASDNLITWGRNLNFLSDTALLEAIEYCKDDLLMARGLIWRTAVVLWAARNGLKRDGDLVECGTYKGTTARIIHRALELDKISRNLWLYDVFNWVEGDQHTPLESLNSDLYGKVLAYFDKSTSVKIIQGYIPESFNKGTPEKISFLHVDMNNAAGEIAVLNTLWDRMVPGAILILDDYGWECLSDQRKAEDAFFAERGYTVLELPTGQGMVLK